MADLTGVWTYRSFINNPAAVETPDEAMALIFGEGELTILAADPAQGIKATLSFGGAAIMDLNCSVTAGDGGRPLTARAEGRGRAGSPIANFAYDYIFYEVPAWPAGVDQRQALVGTTVRAQDHGSAKKGATASTVTVRR